MFSFYFNNELFKDLKLHLEITPENNEFSILYDCQLYFAMIIEFIFNMQRLEIASFLFKGSIFLNDCPKMIAIVNFRYKSVLIFGFYFTASFCFFNYKEFLISPAFEMSEKNF